MIIESLQNEKIKNLNRLITDNRFRKKSGVFVVEGKQENERALQFGFENVEFFICESIFGINHPEGKIHFVSSQVYEKLAYRGTSEGVIGIYKTKEFDLKNFQPKDNASVIVVESVENPGNLGAILRTCDADGVDGVIIGKNRSVGLNGTVAKVSTGAIHHVKVAQVTNLTRTLEDLKKKAFWIVGCELEISQVYRSVDFNMPTVLVIGSEGFGMSRLVKKSCDINVVLPMVGHVNSLNASVAASVLLYQVYNSRHPL